MKKTMVAALLLISSLSAFGQGVDSTQIMDTIVLKRDYMNYINGALGERAGSGYYKFYKQVTAQISSTNDSLTQPITVVAPGWFILECVQGLSGQREGIAASTNKEIQTALLPQIKNQWLLNQLNLFFTRLYMELQGIKARGSESFKAYK